MTRSKTKIKFRLRKNTIFLKLLQNFRARAFRGLLPTNTKYKTPLTLNIYKNNYIKLSKLFYVFELCKTLNYFLTFPNTTSFNIVRYYARANYFNLNTALVKPTPVLMENINNFIIFSRPTKQLFLMFFKEKPIFIFTGGLMRIVMNEKKKSSKKLYKVAVSLIKLFSILLVKKDFFNKGYIKLLNVGNLQPKILMSAIKVNKTNKINYIFIKIRTNFTTQKFETRRAIKKYIKKRFKIR